MFAKFCRNKWVKTHFLTNHKKQQYFRMKKVQIALHPGIIDHRMVNRHNFNDCWLQNNCFQVICQDRCLTKVEGEHIFGEEWWHYMIGSLIFAIQAIMFITEYIKSSCPCENCAFPNKVHHQGLGSTRLQAECFPGSNDVLSWEICDFHMGMGSSFYPITCKKYQGSHVEIVHFHTPLFCMSSVLVMG